MELIRSLCVDLDFFFNFGIDPQYNARPINVKTHIKPHNGHIPLH